MKTKRSHVILIILALALLFSTGFHPNHVNGGPLQAISGEDGLTMLSSSQSGISFHIEVPWQSLVQKTILENDISYIQLVMSGWQQMSEPGAPALPYLVKTIGAPFGAELSLKVTPGKAANTIDSDVNTHYNNKLRFALIREAARSRALTFFIYVRRCE